MAVWHEDNTMTIDIIQCHNLPEIKSFSYRHYYVQTWLKSDYPTPKKVTQVVTGSSSPKFNTKICVSLIFLINNTDLYLLIT